MWVDATRAALADLVDEVGVDEDAGHRELLDATSELVTTRLGLDRPLWRARLLLDADGRVAGVALVAHHVLADGMGGLAVLAALADDQAPVGRPHHPAGTGPPALAGSLPGWRVLARDAWGARAGWVASGPARAHAIGAAGRWWCSP